MARIRKRRLRSKPSPRWRWNDWQLDRLKLAFLFFCSLLVLANGADVEKQELKVTLDVLRKENEGLKRDLATATNRLARVEAFRSIPMGLSADEEEARSAIEWKAFLMNALKVLSQTDQEMQELQKRLRFLLYAAQQAFKSAEKVDASKRALLENEIRQSQKMLSVKEEVRDQPFLAEMDTTALSSTKVVGVRLDLGVAALAIGYKQGARVGMPFLVMRKQKVLAVLTLVEVRETLALALIEQMEQNEPIREGDLAGLKK